MENNLTTLDLLRYMSALLIGSLLGVVIFWVSFFIYEWISEIMKKRRFTKTETKEEKEKTEPEILEENINLLNFSVINDDIKDIVKMIKIQSWEEPDNKKLVKKRFIEEVTDLIYELRYLESYQITAQKYYAFLTEGVSGSVDNVSIVYLKTLIELRIELKKKKYMSDEDKAEYKRREEKLILLIEEEINKNFEKVKEMKHSKNQSALDKADYIIKNGGIR